MLFFQARLVWKGMRRVGWLAYLANIEAGKRLQCLQIGRFASVVAIVAYIQFSRQMSTSQAPLDQSIAQAFINFLEEESSVRSPPTLPVVEMARAKTDQVCI